MRHTRYACTMCRIYYGQFYPYSIALWDSFHFLLIKYQRFVIICYLLEFAILNQHMFVQRMLQIYFINMIELSKGISDIFWHGYIDIAEIIVLVQIQTTIIYPMRMYRIFKCSSDCIAKVLCIFIRLELYAKVICTQIEFCLSSLMFPQAHSSLD